MIVIKSKIACRCAGALDLSQNLAAWRTSTSLIMSSVFLSNVDDYLAPSQACVNPMFTGESNGEKDDEKKETSAGAAVVVPRKQRAARRRANTNVVGGPSIPKTPVKATMADCLACSGCVTTAETVLIEQHSLETLHQKIIEAGNNAAPVAFTISPASFADLLRVLEIDQKDLFNIQRRLVSFLHQHCRARVVLDGGVPLHWALKEAAEEFCRAFRTKEANLSNRSTTPTPSVAMSATETQLANGMILKHTSPHFSTWPVLSSSCPALVCLVEKSTPAAVPHLCSTKSPMAAAGAFFKQSSKDMLHVAVMPCHDKKLEASRKDLVYEDVADVDLVITTSELLDLLQQTLGETIQESLDKFPMAPVYTKMEAIPANEPVAFITTRSNAAEKENGDVIMEDASSESSDEFFSLGSGGYADYIFRYAAQTLFGCKLDSVPWSLVVSESRVQSARVAMARKSRRDFYQVILYRHLDGSFSCERRNAESDVPMLRFATAYGMQTIQRILQPFSNDKRNSQENGNVSPDFPYDYVEAMACPSGCPNGGGQIRATATTTGGAPRETPTETRQRVGETTNVMRGLMESTPVGEQQAVPVDKSLMHTRFHVVPALQHTMGATAGVAVQDTQW